MTDPKPAVQVLPGKGLGFLTLGASLHHILTRLKAQPQLYPTIDLSYSPSEPLIKPVLLQLPDNGLRLRFDGPDQRLRLVEVLDFTKTPFTYKDHEVVKFPNSATDTQVVQGPTFRQVYNRLFGPSYPGEYIPPTSSNGSAYGTYVLSYPGIAFSFPLQHSAWTQQSDFVSLLSSSAALPATSMAVFHGSSWPESRGSLYTTPPQFPRSTALHGRNKEAAPDEVEEAKVHPAGQVELVRRAGSSFWITIGETSPQDLVAELGPPDAIYRKNDRRISIHGQYATEEDTNRRYSSTSPSHRSESTDTDRASNPSLTDDSEVEDYCEPRPGDRSSLASECFYNYFHHGFDAFISYPTADSASFRRGASPEMDNAAPPVTQLAVTKLILHGNVPGSYPFNRHRRSRWTITTGSQKSGRGVLHSEMPFDEVSSGLNRISKNSSANMTEEHSLQRGMVLNRGWGDSPESSVELLGGMEDSLQTRKRSAGTGAEGEEGLGNTELFGFPGLLFEVLKNGSISCLTIY